jgi:hypothetical protein
MSNPPTVSEAAALWRRVLAELREPQPILAIRASEAIADSIDERTLTIYAPHLVATLLDQAETRTDLEILLSVLTDHRVLILHIVRRRSTA